MDIIYTETRLVLARGRALRREDLNQHVVKRLLSTKFRDWSYEDEVRVFLRLKKQDPVTRLYFREFDKDIKLTEVIAGHRCPVGKKEIDQAIGYNPAIEVIKARLAFKSFWVVRNERGFGRG